MSQQRDVLRVRARRLVRAQNQFMKDLVALRKRQGLTQQEVADRMGVSQSAVAQFEHYDANPSLGTVRRYALAIGASIDFKVNAAPVTQETAVSSRRASNHVVKTESPALIKPDWSLAESKVS